MGTFIENLIGNLSNLGLAEFQRRDFEAQQQREQEIEERKLAQSDRRLDLDELLRMTQAAEVAQRGAARESEERELATQRQSREGFLEAQGISQDDPRFGALASDLPAFRQFMATTLPAQPTAGERETEILRNALLEARQTGQIQASDEEIEIAASTPSIAADLMGIGDEADEANRELEALRPQVQRAIREASKILNPPETEPLDPQDQTERLAVVAANAGFGTFNQLASAARELGIRIDPNVGFNEDLTAATEQLSKDIEEVMDHPRMSEPEKQNMVRELTEAFRTKWEPLVQQRFVKPGG